MDFSAAIKCKHQTMGTDICIAQAQAQVVDVQTNALTGRWWVEEGTGISADKPSTLYGNEPANVAAVDKCQA